MKTRPEFLTIRYDLAVRRDGFWGGIKDETVGRWIASLEEERRQLEAVWRGSQMESLGINEEHRKALQRAVEEELHLARFYFEWIRASRRPDFDQWVFKTDFKRNDYDHASDVWVRANGKIEVLIRILKSSVAMTRVSLSIRNDSTELTFYSGNGYGYEWELGHAHLKNPNNIEVKVAEFKRDADQLFKEHSRPRGCDEERQLRATDQLLHNEVV